MRTYVRCVLGRANSRGDGGPVHPIGGGAARLPVVGIHGDLAAAHRPAVRAAVATAPARSRTPAGTGTGTGTG